MRVQLHHPGFARSFDLEFGRRVQCKPGQLLDCDRDPSVIRGRSKPAGNGGGEKTPVPGRKYRFVCPLEPRHLLVMLGVGAAAIGDGLLHVLEYFRLRPCMTGWRWKAREGRYTSSAIRVV